MPVNYQVKQGDCIFSIAVEHGFFADTIWNHPNNAELKKEREDPNVLMPGDVVFVPDKQLKEVSEPTNQVHKFKCKNTPKILSIQLKYIETPLKNLDYTINIDGQEKKGKTDGEGWLKQPISPNAKVAKLTLSDGTQFQLKLGNLDPVDEITGIQGRLNALGLYESSINGQLDEKTKFAVALFQLLNELEVTGETDETTKDLLIQLSGK